MITDFSEGGENPFAIKSGFLAISEQRYFHRSNLLFFRHAWFEDFVKYCAEFLLQFM